MPYGLSQADLGRFSLQIFQLWLTTAHICKDLLVMGVSPRVSRLTSRGFILTLSLATCLLAWMLRQGLPFGWQCQSDSNRLLGSGLSLAHCIQHAGRKSITAVYHSWGCQAHWL